MTATAIFQLVLYVAVLLALARPLGAYMARVYEGNARLAQKVSHRGRALGTGEFEEEPLEGTERRPLLHEAVAHHEQVHVGRSTP